MDSAADIGYVQQFLTGKDVTVLDQHLKFIDGTASHHKGAGLQLKEFEQGTDETKFLTAATSSTQVTLTEVAKIARIATQKTI